VLISFVNNIVQNCDTSVKNKTDDKDSCKESINL